MNKYNIKLLNRSLQTYLLLGFFFLSSYVGRSQTQSVVGQWYAHTSFNQSVSVTSDGYDIYCASRSALIIYSKVTKSFETFTNVDGLSDIGIKTIRFHTGTKNLVIGYETGMIDVFKNGQVEKFDDIKRAGVVGSKSINHLFFIENICYVSTGFGIVLIDMLNMEVQETYYLLQNQSIPVNQITFDGSSFWAATPNGIYRASQADLLQNPKIDWTLVGTRLNGDPCNIIHVFNHEIITNMTVDHKKDTVFRFNGTDWETISGMEMFDVNLSFDDFKGEKLVICHDYNSTFHRPDYSTSGSIWTYQFDKGINPYPVQTIFDEEGYAWNADQNWCLGNEFGEVITPDGPANNYAFRLRANTETVVVVGGGRIASNGNNVYRTGYIHYFKDGNWNSLLGNSSVNVGDFYDLVGLDLRNDKIYAASLGRGILEFNQFSPQNVYNEANSTILEEDPSNSFYFVGVSDVTSDDNGNLWATNTRSIKGLHVKDKNGNWYGYTIPPLMNSVHIRDLLITRNGNKWIQVLDGLTPGIVVFSENNTLSNTNDDVWKLLTVGEGKGNLPSSRAFSMVEDLSGNIWVGTEEGVVVFYTPDRILSETIDGTRILVEKDGYNEYLMDHQNIIAMAVDGANRKWVSSEGVGVFLLSEDGKEELFHFTKENSPLLSNYVTSIAVHPKTGEVFFATEEGIVSYRSDATEGQVTYNDAYVFPNPVKSNYGGVISITNLMKNSTVKITDITGNIVYETTSKGGQASWDGKTFNHQRVQTGVYLIYCYSEDGSSRFAGKMIFVN